MENEYNFCPQCGAKLTQTANVDLNVGLRIKRSVRRLLDESEQRPRKYTKNEFEEKKDGKVIYDKATGLIWQQSGSEKYMTYDEALNYIRQLNQEGFADYNDWRLPTLRDAITLLKPEKLKKHYLFIDLLFNDKQKRLWTSTFGYRNTHWAWIVDFIHGDCRLSEGKIYVRAVR